MENTKAYLAEHPELTDEIRATVLGEEEGEPSHAKVEGEQWARDPPASTFCPRMKGIG